MPRIYAMPYTRPMLRLSAGNYTNWHTLPAAGAHPNIAHPSAPSQ